jgi:hypothetical protein
MGQAMVQKLSELRPLIKRILIRILLNIPVAAQSGSGGAAKASGQW